MQLIDRCSIYFQTSPEMLQGTSVRFDTLLAIENDGWLGKKSVDNMDNTLPDKTKELLQTFVQKAPHRRIQLIKKPERRGTQEVHVYVALVNSTSPTLYHYTLPGYDAVSEIDLEGIAAGSAAYDSDIETDPLYFVCSDGLRDTCCGQFGGALYMKMQGMTNPQRVWQSTHLGGHRFAPTMLVLPLGVSYGQVREDEEAQAIVEASDKRQMHLPNLRGKSMYDGLSQAEDADFRGPIQQADYYLRDYLLSDAGETALEVSAVQFRDASKLANGRWQAVFDVWNGQTYAVELEETHIEVVKSCGAEPAVTPQFTLGKISIYP